MDFRPVSRGAWIAATLCGLLLSPGMASAVAFSEFVDPNPAAGNQFGNQVVPLSTGNVVITSPNDDAGGSDAGAVYLFDGATGTLISTLRGSTANDRVGSGGVKALSNGNFVISSPNWNNSAGAVTWGSGTTGVAGTVSAANSLVGSASGDNVGLVTVLPNGNYVVSSTSWNNGAVVDAGAATWGNGTTGVAGVVSAANSLVGTTAGDFAGGQVTVLSNGNYVVRSQQWDNGAANGAGAVTWGNGATGIAGAISAANSLVGTAANDNVGIAGVTALTNGNYVVASSNWNNGAVSRAGAATWGSGTTGVTGAVSAANSLVGSTADDFVSSYGVTALSNGNYVVRSPAWDDGAVTDAGAATWCDGTTGLTGAVSVANSLVGSTASDLVGVNGLTALSNGNYVVHSPFWDDGAVADAGAATWGSGTTGVTGAVSAANSLVGSTASDNIGNTVTALSNGNYVVANSFWDNSGITNAGAATWGSGTTGVTGVVSGANSLVGSMLNDFVGSGVTALSNGNYVVTSPSWRNGGIASAGAATWGSGTTGVTGAVSAANSLVGSSTSDNVGSSGVMALSNGNYVVLSSNWNNGATADAGAATWGSGTTGVTGAVSAANSLVGSTANDFVGNSGVTALSNGNYVVRSSNWRNGAAASAGAVTWGNGTTGVTGAVSVANSLVGSTANDFVGSSGVTALSNADYVVASSSWDNGALVNAGAATLGYGTTGVTGVVSTATSLVGAAANTNLQTIVVDDVNGTFFGRFILEGGGRVRVGPPALVPGIVSLLDIPSDQGGWLRLTLSRSSLDDAGGLPPISMYGVWRHIPGTLPSGAGRASTGATPGVRLDEASAEWLRTAVAAGLGMREEGGRFYAARPGRSGPEVTTAFPPGTWELVASVPALQQSQYAVAVPTISNAAPNDFVVTAHTTTPSIWYISEPASGQSVDNLAPATPAGLTAGYSGGQTNLQWTANSENDLGSYCIYRGTSADFIPGAGNLVGTVTSSAFGHVGPAGGYYKVSAKDVNDNESGFALITPQQTTGVDGESPVAFALEGARPNPANGGRLEVAFALPAGGPARIELVDVSGRRVLAREVGSLGPGRHTVNLAAGRGVAPGLYWVRLTHGANRRQTRVAVVE